MNIIGERIILRAIEEKDLIYLKEIINDPNSEKYVLGWSKPVSMIQQEEWFKSVKNDESSIRFVVESENQFIGTCILNNIDWKNRSIGINIKLLEKYRNNGYGKECIQLLVKYCYEEINMNRIEANILEYNIASQRLFEKCGFILEGKKRKSIYKNNKYNDVRIYSLLKDEYNKNEE